MIHGIGTDIVRIARLTAMWERHGEATAERVLAPCERADFAAARDKGRFLAKRWAAKEAFSKALGTGIRGATSLHAIGVTHDELGKPLLVFDDALATLLAERGLRAHLSLSDEADVAVAYVILEKA